jgi:hypothetical protein
MIPARLVEGGELIRWFFSGPKCCAGHSEVVAAVAQYVVDMVVACEREL